jgi:hypothetical protein
MAHDIFLSHSRHDKLTADAVCNRLESAGIRCWLAPRNVDPGADWTESILQAIRSCRVMVLVFSDHANESRHVRIEVAHAFKHELIIIPFRIYAAPPKGNLEYYLDGVHWLDALTLPLEQHLEALTVRLKALMPLGEAGLSTQAFHAEESALTNAARSFTASETLRPAVEHEVKERFEASARESEEKERQETERRQREEQDQLQAAQREKDRVEAEQRECAENSTPFWFSPRSWKRWLQRHAQTLPKVKILLVVALLAFGIWIITWQLQRSWQAPSIPVPEVAIDPGLPWPDGRRLEFPSESASYRVKAGIKGGVLHLRESPANNSKILKDISEGIGNIRGYPYDLVSTGRDTWMPVEYENTKGYLDKSSLDLISVSTPAPLSSEVASDPGLPWSDGMRLKFSSESASYRVKAGIKGGVLHLRESPANNSKILKDIPEGIGNIRGYPYDLVSTGRDTWMPVEYENTKGYLDKSSLDLISVSTPAP